MICAPAKGPGADPPRGAVHSMVERSDRVRRALYRINVRRVPSICRKSGSGTGDTVAEAQRNGLQGPGSVPADAPVPAEAPVS